MWAQPWLRFAQAKPGYSDQIWSEQRRESGTADGGERSGASGKAICRTTMTG